MNDLAQGPSARKTKRVLSDDKFRVSVGGLPSSLKTGETHDLDGLHKPSKIAKSILGIPENPHYEVYDLDIMTDAPEFAVVEPVYPYTSLTKLYYLSTMLRQAVDAYVTNIESYGVTLEYVGPEDQRSSRAAKNEKLRIERILASVTTDGRSMRQHREASRVDKEVLGARCFEVIQDAAGRVVHFDHVPANTIRMTKQEKDYTKFTTTDKATGAVVVVNRRFRRFLQVDADGNVTWFKEYGDPRPIDPKTGKVDYSLSIEDEATAIYYDYLYTPGTPYGVPRWVGAIPSLLGSYEAETVNLNFFRDNAIPAMAILVSGGALTAESFDKIDSYIQGVRGQASMNRIVVMEAMADGSDAAAIDGSAPAPKVDIKPMLSERQHEGLFKNYIEEAERKTRQSFRLPPLYIGSATEYNRASAFASVLTADQQIFIPERLSWDTMFQDVVLSTHGIKYWRLRTDGPGLQDPQEIARVVNSLGREGALTPNAAIKIANRYLDADITPVHNEWGDLPFSVIMQYIKNDKVLEGLDIFVDNVNSAAEGDTVGLPTQGDDGDVVTAIRKLLNKVSDTLADDLTRAIDDMQSTTTEVL